MMVVQSLLFRSLESREYAMQRLFPGRDLNYEREEAEKGAKPFAMDQMDKEADTAGNILIKHMTSMNMTLKYMASELLFSLVGENADELVRLTGFGNAAGLLAMRNLFGMGKHLGGDTASELRKQEQPQQEKQEQQEQPQPVATPKKKFPDLKSAKEGETDEEREERTLDNLEKMMEAGLIKVIKKDDKDKDTTKEEKKDG